MNEWVCEATRQSACVKQTEMASIFHCYLGKLDLLLICKDSAVGHTLWFSICVQVDFERI